MLETILGILITIVIVAIAIIISKLWPIIWAMLPAWAATVLANIYVYLVEKEQGNGGGAEKFALVLEKVAAYLAAFNIHIDTDVIRAAIEAAWSKMNAEQVTAGIKHVA